tara:strand:+ start:329 stop:817 length:489 start_codon:yes stop_codon:yes gene_type:complete
MTQTTAGAVIDKTIESVVDPVNLVQRRNGIVDFLIFGGLLGSVIVLMLRLNSLEEELGKTNEMVHRTLGRRSSKKNVPSKSPPAPPSKSPPAPPSKSPPHPAQEEDGFSSDEEEEQTVEGKEMEGEEVEGEEVEGEEMEGEEVETAVTLEDNESESPPPNAD